MVTYLVRCEVTSPCKLHGWTLILISAPPAASGTHHADLDFHLAEPEEELQVLEGLVGSHHQCVELLLHPVVQTCDRLHGVSAITAKPT